MNAANFANPVDLHDFELLDHLTIDEVSEALGYSKYNILKLVRVGKLRAFQSGRSLRFLRRDVADFVRAQLSMSTVASTTSAHQPRRRGRPRR